MASLFIVQCIENFQVKNLPNCKAEFDKNQTALGVPGREH